jgi:osmotically-inducible protein OsmY
VVRELQRDPRLATADVHVDAQAGVVILTGTVADAQQRLAAERRAHSATGVLDVANDIRVRTAGGMVLSDAEIARTVRQALVWHATFPAERIHSTVASGWVTLTGTVDTYHQRAEATRLVHTMAGIQGVFNQITVRSLGRPSEDVRLDIEKAVSHRLGYVPDGIEISIRAGHADLAGPVRSWVEKEALLDAAHHTLGVQVVDDHL